MSDYRVHAGEAQEDQVTAAIEKYTSQVPSSAYLGLAIASIAASVTFQVAKKEHLSLFVGQWVAPFLLLGIYNKMVKQHGSDAKTKEV
jgi:D-serine dehydratase